MLKHFNNFSSRNDVWLFHKHVCQMELWIEHYLKDLNVIHWSQHQHYLFLIFVWNVNLNDKDLQT
jgi:hypothetical protein